MQCQNCKQQTATIHLTEISNGQRVETHLCQNCALEQGLTIQSQIPLHELLNTLLSTPGEPGGKDKGTDKACPHCGMTLRRFTKESLLGCPHDYEVFEKSLLPLIESSQNGRSEHCGKIPASSGPEQENKARLSALKKQLQKAVQCEDYEAAARLRDEIQRFS